MSLIMRKQAVNGHTNLECSTVVLTITSMTLVVLNSLPVLSVSLCSFSFYLFSFYLTKDTITENMENRLYII